MRLCIPLGAIRWRSLVMCATTWPEITVRSIHRQQVSSDHRANGFTRGGTLPAGLTIFGRPWDEGHLFAFAYAYEQARTIASHRERRHH